MTLTKTDRARVIYPAGGGFVTWPKSSKPPLLGAGARGKRTHGAEGVKEHCA